MLPVRVNFLTYPLGYAFHIRTKKQSKDYCRYFIYNKKSMREGRKASLEDSNIFIEEKTYKNSIYTKDWRLTRYY